jgi:phosphatidylglycerophosphate synthase
MASIYDLKPRFQALLRPLITKLAAWGWTANLVTFLALLFSLIVGGLLLFAQQNPVVLLVLPVWLFLRMALNAIDGMMARELNMKSTLGAVLNEVGDIISDLALYLPLAFVHPPSLWPVVAFSLGAVLTEFCALGLITAFAPGLFKFWPWLFAVAAALTVLTCLNRLKLALAELRK